MPLSQDQWLALGSAFGGGALGDLSSSMGRASESLYQLRQEEEKRRIERERLERELADRREAMEERERLRQNAIEDRERQLKLQVSVEDKNRERTEDRAARHSPPCR